MQKTKSLFQRVFLSLVLAASASFAWPAWAESPDQTLIKLLDEFLAGASANNMAAHERFWSDDLVYTSSAGERYGKADIIGPMKDAEGKDAPETAANKPATVYGREALLVRVYGDTAVVTFRLVGTEQTEPPVVSQYYNTGTFLLRDGEWRAVAWQATRIPEGE